MTIKIAQVEDIIAGLSPDGVCSTLPVCMCSYPDDVWETYRQLFALVNSKQDLAMLKRAICCVLKGEGTFETPEDLNGPEEPDGLGTGTTPPATTTKPTGTGAATPPVGQSPPAKKPQPWESGMSVPEGTACANFLAEKFCGPADKVVWKTISAALTIASYASEAGAAVAVKLDSLKTAIDAILLVCESDPSMQGAVALVAIKSLCEKLKATDLSYSLPGVGKLQDVPAVVKLLNTCCDWI